ncbi:MAG TPA: hypothetical protein VGC47_02450 [Acidimicrobiia bacterium]|jgi:hypothetical protein
MPTESEEAARLEADRWMAIARNRVAGPLGGQAADPTEQEVIPEVDPLADLSRRARQWSYLIADAGLADLCRFAAGLAAAEAVAWAEGDGPTATKAYSDRRFLAADRIVPWAVPWLDAAARSSADPRIDADKAALLAIGDRLRVAPALGAWGVAGDDGYGPTGQPGDLVSRLRSLWGGLVIPASEAAELAGGSADPHAALAGDGPLVARLYEDAARRWEGLAGLHAGSAGCWLDLAARARLTVRVANG